MLVSLPTQPVWHIFQCDSKPKGEVWILHWTVICALKRDTDSGNQKVEPRSMKSATTVAGCDKKCSVKPWYSIDAVLITKYITHFIIEITLSTNTRQVHFWKKEIICWLVSIELPDGTSWSADFASNDHWLTPKTLIGASLRYTLRHTIHLLIKSGSIPANVSHTLAFLSNYVRRSAANWSCETRTACDVVQMKLRGRCGAELFMLALLKRDHVVESDIKNDLEPLVPFIIQPLK